MTLREQAAIAAMQSILSMGHKIRDEKGEFRTAKATANAAVVNADALIKRLGESNNKADTIDEMLAHFHELKVAGTLAKPSVKTMKEYARNLRKSP